MYSSIASQMLSNGISPDYTGIFQATSEKHSIFVSENRSKHLPRRHTVPHFAATPSKFLQMIGPKRAKQTSLKLFEIYILLELVPLC